MPRVEYRRIDLPVRIGRDGEGLIVLRMGSEASARTVGLGVDWMTSGDITAGDLG